ncbi:hypothetical protein pb186bvf_017364 [Paramecium bursaria]
MSKAPRQKVGQCELCQKSFGMLQVQHQCKRCKRAICHDCGNQKSKIVNFDLKTVHRICKVCAEEQKQLQDLLQKEGLVFNQNSVSSRNILNKISPGILQSAIDEEYFWYLNESKTKIDKQTLTIIPTMVQDARNSYNFSMYEMDFYLTSQLQANTIAAFVSSIIQVLLVKYPKMKITQKVINLVLFLLYFNSQPNVFFIISYLWDDQQLNVKFSDEQQSSEVEQLLDVIKKNFLIEACDIIFYRKYCENYGCQILFNYYINYLNFPATFFLFNHLIQYGIYDFERAIGLIGNQNIKEIKSRGQDQEYLLSYFCKNVQVAQIKEYLIKQERSRVQSKRDVHSKSDDCFQQLSEKLDHQGDLRSVLQILDDCINKGLPLNNQHRGFIARLPHRYQLILSELIGTRPHKLSAVKEIQMIEDNDDTKHDTESEASYVNDQHKLLLEEISKLKAQLKQQRDERNQDMKDLEEVFNQQEEIKRKLEITINQDFDSDQHIQNDDLYVQQLEFDLNNTKQQLEKSQLAYQALQKENINLITQIEQQQLQIEQQQLEMQIQTQLLQEIHKQSTTDTSVDVDHNETLKQNELILQLQKQLEEQKIFYENKLQQTGVKQQKAIEKLMNDIMGKQAQPQQEKVIVIENKPKSQTINKQNELKIDVQQRQRIETMQPVQTLQPVQAQQDKKEPSKPESKECIIF